jgi:hypothetical protein
MELIRQLRPENILFVMCWFRGYPQIWGLGSF